MTIAAQKPKTAAQPSAASLDLYLLDELLSDEEREMRDRVRGFCEREICRSSTLLGARRVPL